MNNTTNPLRIRLIAGEKQKEFPEKKRLKAHYFSQGMLLLEKKLNVQEVLMVIDELHRIQEELLDSLDKACGPCDEICGSECPFQDQGRFWLPSDLLAMADIPEDAKLLATPDPEEGVIIISEADEWEKEPHEMLCFSMRLVAERGLCLSRLSKLMKSKQIVYEVD